MKKLSNLAWIDLEMTGLDPEQNVILEISSIVTDKDLNIICEGPSFVIHQSQDEMAKMNDFVTAMHAKSGLDLQVSASTTTTREAELKTIEFFNEFLFLGASPLCGNSIWQDRRFLSKHMPELNNFFSYRIIDVSSVKEIVRRWYPDNPATEFKKSENHRALEDIRESIAELEHYRKNFFIPAKTEL